MTRISRYDDKTLFALISRGDEVAFRELYQRYKERVYGVSLKMTHSGEIASDIVQDVFLSIWKNRERLLLVDNPSSYLFTATYRNVYQHFRKVALERKIHIIAEKKVQTGNITEDTVIEHESRNLLSVAISQLPPQQKMVFKLSREEGYSREEVAEYLNISPNTVRNHLAKAVKFVQTYLKVFATILISIL